MTDLDDIIHELSQFDTIPAVSKAVAYLAALASKAGEPVAHRYRGKNPSSGWMPVLTPGDLEYIKGRPEIYEVQPLYVSPPPSEATVEATDAEVDALWKQLLEFIEPIGSYSVGRNEYNDAQNAKAILRAALSRPKP